METKTERIYSSDSRIGEATATPETELHPHDIDRFHDDGGPVPPERDEAIPVSRGDDGAVSEQPATPTGPPPGYEAQ